MMAEESAISGTQRAAIFLLGLGEAGAASIMRHMSPKEVQRVGEAMASLSQVTNEQVSHVLKDFSSEVNEINPLGIGARDFTRRVMIEALGETKARSLLNKMDSSVESKGMEALKWMDARSVAGVIGEEHPQVMALVLASLDPDHAAQVLALLPRELQTDLVMRIARLDSVDVSAMTELDAILEKQLGMGQKAPPSTLNGLKTVAHLLNHLDAGLDQELLDTIKSEDEPLAGQIHDLMFVFENLLDLDDRGMQRLLREVAVDSLVIALKGVDDRLKNKFFDNMSSRAAEMLKEDLESKGPVKISEVEAAQKAILATASQLSDAGEIFLGGKGGEQFV